MLTIKSILSLLAGSLLSYASLLFFYYNRPIIKNLPLFILPVAVALLVLVGISLAGLLGQQTRMINSIPLRLGAGIFLLLSAAVMIYAFLKSALLDYFQPFSLYDDVIFITLAGFLLLIVRFCLDVWGYFFGNTVGLLPLLSGFAVLLFLAAFWGWGLLQEDFAYQHIKGDPVHLFVGGEDGYAIYRIPGLIVIPAGERLADGRELENDLVLVFAEARRNGSLDDGDIDLVMKRSWDGGDNWSELVVVRQWEEGVGKIGNPTPVFDQHSGLLYLFHIAGNRPYDTWMMRSRDGGVSFDLPEKFRTGIVGPGHGVQIMNGIYAGRLLIPAHSQGSSEAILSANHGINWQVSNPVGVGNESEIAETWDGRLIKVLRTNHPVAKPHEELQAQFSFSDDGGLTWSEAAPNLDLRTPICMASILRGREPDLLFSYPNDYYSRARMSLARSDDNGQTFPHKILIYVGPSGYSDLGLLSNGDVMLIFENGAVEYDERLTLVRIVP